MKRIITILLAFLMAAFFCLVFTGCQRATPDWDLVSAFLGDGTDAKLDNTQQKHPIE